VSRTGILFIVKDDYKHTSWWILH